MEQALPDVAAVEWGQAAWLRHQQRQMMDASHPSHGWTLGNCTLSLKASEHVASTQEENVPIVLSCVHFGFVFNSSGSLSVLSTRKLTHLDNVFKH